MKTRILALDPGLDNFGFSALEISGKRTFRVVRCGMLSRRIKVLTGDLLKGEALLYRKRVNRLIRKSKPDHLVAERYVPRRQGIANESINYMLGYILCELASTEMQVDLFLAATWKVRVKKLFDLEAFYAQFNQIPDHQIDATMIGLYLAEKKYGFDLANFANAAVRKRLGNQLMKVSLHKKPPPRKRAAAKPKPKRKVK